MADTAPSKAPVPRSDEAAARDGHRLAPAPSDADNVTFSNTRKQANTQKVDGAGIERFTNTKLNIALINDPKNGPRFTLTKREAGLAGLAGEAGDGETSEVSEPAGNSEPARVPETSGSSRPGDDETTLEPSPPVAVSAAAPPDDGAAGPPSPEPGTAGDDDQVLRPADDRKMEAAGASQRQDASAKADAVADIAKPAPSGVPPAAIPPSKIPVDSSKTFIGLNGTYYDESWRWMDWRGTRRSWNWPAAFSFGHWFAYRRLYSLAGLHLVWLAGLAAATVNDIPVLGLILMALLVVGLTGVYGNILYFRAFRRAVGHVTEKGEGSYEERQDQLAASGGTSVIALGVMGALSLAAVIGAVGVTYHVRGSFLLNFWPFF